MSDWEQQQDGTLLPSAELVDHIRTNRAQYPNAVSDFAKITGKSEQEVQSIFDNSGSYFGFAGSFTTDVIQGGLDAAATAAENLIPAETLGDGGKMIRDFSQSLDPKFETQKGIVENLSEGLGMAVPAIAATIGTGGWAGVAIGAGVSTITMADSDNIGNAMEQVAPGITPDILVINEGDSEAVKTMKTLASNTVIDAISLGAYAVAGKALKGLTKGLTKAAAKEAVSSASPVVSTLESAATSAAKSEVVKATESAAVGVPKELEEASAEAVSRKIDASISYDEYETLTKKRAREKLVARLDNAASPTSVDPVNGSLRDRFIFNATAAVDNLDRRVGDITESIKKSASLPAEVRDFGMRVYDAIHSGDDDTLLKTLKDGVKVNGTINQAYAQNAVAGFVRESLLEKQIGFDEMIKLLREQPELTSRMAASKTLDDVTDTMIHLTEVDRALGSSASYQMHLRKGLIKGDERTVREAEAFLKDRVKKEMGLDLFSDKFQFVNYRSGELRKLGLDPVKVLPQLEEEFNKFDLARQGSLDNLKHNAAVRLSKKEKASLFGSYVRMVKEIQTTALLSQFSTAFLEAGTNTVSNMLLPAMEHGLASGNFSRMAREYAGYKSALGAAWKVAKDSFKAGRGVLDGFDITEGADNLLAYENFKGKPMQYMMLRMFKLASDAALASSEFWKAARAHGLAYADGIDLALKAGKGRREAKAFAREYAAGKFDASGQLLDAALGEDVARTSWQSSFDTRYWTGKLGQEVDNIRNRDDIVGLMGRMAIPFFRTLVNIGSDSVQFIVPPGLPTAMKMLAKTPEGSWLRKVPKFMRAIDDFTGANGETARLRAVGRHRLGMAATLSALGMVSMSDGIEITGSSRTKRWDAKKRAFEEYPANSIIIGDTSYDLSRALPFSAPLMLVGMMRDMEIEDQMHIEGGNYAADSTANDLVNYLPAIAMTTATLFQDSSATQGVFDLFDAMQQAWEEQNMKALQTYLEKYTQQFTPGLIKMAAKNSNTTSYEGGVGAPEDFFTRYMAAAGFPVGYEKLDFIGEPVTSDLGRGINPLNPKAIHLDSPIHKEFVFLNKLEGLALVPPKPDAVFDKAYWKKLGVRSSGLFFDSASPSLTHMKTASGKDAWVQYRDYLYNSYVSQDVEVSTGSQGDHVDIGKVIIRKGENFKSAMTRLIDTESYKSLTPDARSKVWNSVFAYFKGQAKDQLAEELVISDDVFDGSRYGSPISGDNTLSNAESAVAPMAVETQRTKSSPLDAAFNIKR